MRHLLCSRCSKRLIENFWLMVEAETEPTFCSFNITCDCGERVRVTPRRRPRWVKLESALPAIARHV
jgi:RNase P subunit RPR2